MHLSYTCVSKCGKSKPKKKKKNEQLLLHNSNKQRTDNE